MNQPTISTAQALALGRDMLRRKESARECADRTGHSAATCNRCAQAAESVRRLRGYEHLGILRLVLLGRICGGDINLRAWARWSESRTVYDLRKEVTVLGEASPSRDGRARAGRSAADPVVRAKYRLKLAKAELAAALRGAK